MRVKLLEGLPPFKKKRKVYVALKGEVCVRTDLVRSVTTDVTKQAVGSGRAGCTGTAVFNQRWRKNQQSHSFPLVLPLSLACALSLLSASHRP